MVRRLLLVVVAAAAFAIAASAAPAQPGDALVVTHALAPQTTAFGDPIVAVVRVLVDPVRIDLDSLRLRTEFAPWREERTVERQQLGDRVAVTWTLTLRCITGPCVNDERQRLFSFSEAALVYRRGGERGARTLGWPPIEVSTRLARTYVPPTVVDAPPVWRAAVALPAPSYRADPRRLRLALLAAGAALLVASLALAFVALRRPRVPRAVPALEVALRRLERARTPSERRAALEAVAVEVHPALAEATRQLAWSPREPSDPEVRELSAQVRGAAS